MDDQKKKKIIEGEEVGLRRVKSSRKAALGNQQWYFQLKWLSSRFPSHLETQHPLTCTSSHLPLPAPTIQSEPQSALARIKGVPEIPSKSILPACKLHIFACWLSLREQGEDILKGTGFNKAFKQIEDCPVNDLTTVKRQCLWEEKKKE